MIMWKKGANGEEIPEPQAGLDEDFDRVNEAIDGVKDEF